MEPEKQFPWDPIAEASRLWASHGWRSAAAGMAAITSVMRAHQILLARVDHALRPFDITFARYEVLMLLYFSRSGELPMKKIGQRLQVHPASVTNAIDRLESAGLVRRKQRPNDRRTAIIELTAEGLELALKATEVINREVFEAPGLPAHRISELVEILADLRSDAGDF
jgi:DNA-binding MarR family transcriptional regulator